ncbi:MULTISPECIES: leucyl aminopeptidase [unclassified Schlesneria]|uniref:leucyl aminopeptidase n=1 Tax=Schlesneria TaxID=656899 RepID=UPI002EF9CC8C
MEIRQTNRPLTQVESDWLVVPVVESAELPQSLAELDQALGGLLTRLKTVGDLTGKLASTLALRGLSGIGVSRLLCIGLGKAEDLTIARVDKALMTAARAISDKPGTRVAFAVPHETIGAVSPEAFATAATTCGIVGSQGQDLFRTERSRHPFASIEVVSADGSSLGEATERGQIVGQAINLTRDLVNRPPQEITPLGFARRAQAAAEEVGLRIEILEQPRLEQERMRSMLAVAQGSTEPPCMVVLEHNGGGPNAPRLALVGKGVTFDSGGLSLKPSDGMLTMKCDMAGAATVLGAMTAIARLKLPVNVVGYMGMVENMISGSAFKLGDILTARNGVTIEVLNTDAEGRLVLADVLSYAVDAGVDKIVDLATLTGACVVALGEDVSGAFTNDQPWCDKVLTAAKTTGEDVWQLPMWDLYEDLIKGDVGDIKNTGGRWGGAISAARFLQHFVGTKPWVHLDIAGPAYASSNKGHREAGATGHMVKSLIELARQFGA